MSKVVNLSSGSSSIGFLGLLVILFVGLKLTGYITWSWWLVLSPIIFSISISILILIVILIAVIFKK